MQRSIRNLTSLITVIAIVFLPLSTHAANDRVFDAQAFKTAQEAGKPILIEIHADWCPTCKAQQPVLNKLSADTAYSGIVRFRVDFDGQKAVVKQFNAKTQSTLILYKGKTEVARSVGETDEDRLRAMLHKVL
jgi:thioredoxin 1